MSESPRQDKEKVECKTFDYPLDSETFENYTTPTCLKTSMPALAENLIDVQTSLFFAPDLKLQEDLYEIYHLNQIQIGWPEGAQRMLNQFARDHTSGFIGVQFGDEGKGRFVDNKIESILKIDGIKCVYVVRYNGGSNAGHSIVRGDERFAVHQIPSGILYPEAVGVMDRGMIIHPEDLKIEIEDIEIKVGDLRGKLFLSEEAILATDLERAEEVFNRTLSEGKSEGGTGRGISPAYAHFYDRLGVQVRNLMWDNWRDEFGERYDRYETYFKAFGVDLQNMDVPDLRETRKQGIEVSRKVGSKQEFLDRLESVRRCYSDRDEGVTPAHKMITNTYLLHRKNFLTSQKEYYLREPKAWVFIPGSEPDRTLLLQICLSMESERVRLFTQQMI